MNVQANIHEKRRWYNSKIWEHWEKNAQRTKVTRYQVSEFLRAQPNSVIEECYAEELAKQNLEEQRNELCQ